MTIRSYASGGSARSLSYRRPASQAALAIDFFTLARQVNHGFIIALALGVAVTSSLGLSHQTRGMMGEGVYLPDWQPPRFFRLPLDSRFQDLRNTPVPITHRTGQVSTVSSPDMAVGEAVVGGQEALPRPRTDVVTYRVASGDTVIGIAERFGIISETVMWANQLSNPDRLQIGDELRIPPTDGVLHTVREGDSVGAIAAQYKVEREAILGYAGNHLSNPDLLALDQELIIPGGKPPPPPPARVATAKVSSAAPLAANASPQQRVASEGGSLAWPTYGPMYGFFGGGHEGLDISPPYGTPIVAAEAGRVVDVLWWTWSYGWHVVIDHGNGFTTLYAHLSEMPVKVGDVVQRGQFIGRVGATGKVTGPHLHFEVRYHGKVVNPLDYLPR